MACSLKLGVVSAHELMRTFQGSGRNSSLARALAEYGRMGKTLYLLDLVDDELYRQSLLIQVNTGERRRRTCSRASPASCRRGGAPGLRLGVAVAAGLDEAFELIRSRSGSLSKPVTCPHTGAHCAKRDAMLRHGEG